MLQRALTDRLAGTWRVDMQPREFLPERWRFLRLWRRGRVPAQAVRAGGAAAEAGVQATGGGGEEVVCVRELGSALVWHQHRLHRQIQLVQHLYRVQAVETTTRNTDLDFWLLIKKQFLNFICNVFTIL